MPQSISGRRAKTCTDKAQQVSRLQERNRHLREAAIVIALLGVAVWYFQVRKRT